MIRWVDQLFGGQMFWFAMQLNWFCQIQAERCLFLPAVVLVTWDWGECVAQLRSKKRGHDKTKSPIRVGVNIALPANNQQTKNRLWPVSLKQNFCWSKKERSIFRSKLFKWHIQIAKQFCGVFCLFHRSFLEGVLLLLCFVLWFFFSLHCVFIRQVSCSSNRSRRGQ